MGEEPEFILLQFLGGSRLAAYPTNFWRGRGHMPTLEASGGVVCTVTYLIGIGGFNRLIAGSTTMFFSDCYEFHLVGNIPHAILPSHPARQCHRRTVSRGRTGACTGGGWEGSIGRDGRATQGGQPSGHSAVAHAGHHLFVYAGLMLFRATRC
jgi:hypothetical protein